MYPPFTALVWRFPHRCVLDGPSIEPGLAAVASSHSPHPSHLFLPSLLHPNALFAWGVDTPGVARTFYYTDEASRLFTDTTQKIDTQRFQVAAVMGTSVPGLPVRDCAESCKSSVPRCAKMSTVDVMNKTIFEHLYLVQGLGTLYLKSNVPMYSHPHRSQTSDFSISVQFHGNPEIAAI